MTFSPEKSPTIKVVRIDRAKWRAGQALIPLAILTAVVSRYVGSFVPLIASVALQFVVIVTFVRARRSFGRQSVHVEGGKIHLGDPDPIIPADVARWTLYDTDAHLYGAKTTWKLSTSSHDQAKRLRDELTRVLGRPLQLHRRGSPRARKIALIVAIAGSVTTAVAIAVDVTPVMLLGLPAAILGIATFGALSQKAPSEAN